MDGPKCDGCRERDARIAALELRVAELEALVKDQARLIANLSAKLQDADLPKSQPGSKDDTPPPDKSNKKTAKRKPGGQSGHPPHLKKLLPPERVTKTIPLMPPACAHCGESFPKNLEPTGEEPLRHQVAELPDVRAEVTEYQGHSRACPCCGEVTQASIPAEIRAHSIGAGLAALMAYLVGNCGLSKRRVEEFVEAVLEVPISLGTVSRLEQETSAALAGPHGEALQAVREAAVKHADETGWKKAGHKRWLWVVATSQVVVFVIHRLRNAGVIVQLLGDTLQGILCTDRYRAYDWAPLRQRQICWAHLKRNFEKLVDRGGKAKAIGEACLAVQSRIFELWHLFRGGGLTRDQLGDEAAPLMLEFLEILDLGERSRDQRLVRFCEGLRKVYPALWTFLVVEDVEPTNNHAERVQRLAVLYRKNCFGCHSDSGCRFVERLLTVVQTLRVQQRPTLAYLTAAIKAHRAGLAAPPLVNA